VISGNIAPATNTVGFRFGPDPATTYDVFGHPNAFLGDGVGGIYAWGYALNFGVDSTYEAKQTADLGLTEVFRGNTAKFPRRSLWVAEATRVVGYDLTQPGNPMWMVFAGGSEFVLRASNCTSLSLREGVLYVGQQGALGTLARVNFAADVCDFYHTAGLFKRSLPTVANRNATADGMGRSGHHGHLAQHDQLRRHGDPG
jgi:hypothetical protein